MGASWAPPGSKTPPRRLLKASWAVLGPSWGPLGGEHGSNKAPKLSKHPITICIKLGPIFDTPWEGYILRYCWIFDAKMELKWFPNGVKFRYGLANTDFYELVVSVGYLLHNLIHRDAWEVDFGIQNQ